MRGQHLADTPHKAAPQQHGVNKHLAAVFALDGLVLVVLHFH